MDPTSHHEVRKIDCAFIDEDTVVYTVVKEMAEYKHGGDSLRKFFTLKGDCDKKGTSYISFIILKDGTLCDFKVLKGINEECDNLAIERVKSSEGQWKIGKQNGQEVNMSMAVGVKFN